MRGFDHFVFYLAARRSILYIFPVNPLVSVITPAYNAEKFIAETIDSVRAQTHTNWEHLIVVDSKTSDQTRAIVAQYAKKDSRIRLLEDALVSGVSENRNLALKKAQGEYIAFLDSDDLWLPRKIEMQLRYMQKQNSSFCFHSYEIINENGDALNQDRRAPLIATYRSLLQHNCIGCLTVMIKRTLAQKFHFKNESHEDFCLWLDILREQKAAVGMPDFLASYRIVKNSRSNNKVHAAAWRWKILRQREKLGLFPSLFYFTSYVLTSLRMRT